MPNAPKWQALSAGSYPFRKQTVAAQSAKYVGNRGPREKSGGFFVREEDPKKNTQAGVAALFGVAQKTVSTWLGHNILGIAWPIENSDAEPSREPRGVMSRNVE